MEKIISYNTIDFDDQFSFKLNNLAEYDSKLKHINKTYGYGTSGFRYNENELDKISFRVAIVLCLQSQINEGVPMGIIVTASHNKYTDNGFKIAGLKGESIDSDWENIYTTIVNSKNLADDIKAIIPVIYEKEKKNKYFFRDYTPVINLAFDTRRSSGGLSKIIIDCLQIFKAKFINYGVLTTPSLQFLTLLNHLQFKKANHILSQFSFVDVDEYWRFLNRVYYAFNTFYEQFYIKGAKGNGINNTIKNITENNESKYEHELLVDCANGAAAYHHENIAKIFNDRIKLVFINTDYKNYNLLNEGCGAEHVHKEKIVPINYPANCITKNVSLDGDVDRIIYFVSEKGTEAIKIVDGDHLACLYALTLNFLIGKLSKSLQARFLKEIKIGVVCTAYSNGAFMNYIQSQLQFTLLLAKTGVKHLHHKAKNYDIAIYFESNGHGTVYSHEDILKKIEKLNCFIESSADSQTLELISIFLSMFNRTTGDSLSAMIATEASLILNNMRMIDVYNIYNEFESVNEKVVIKNKNVFVPNEDDTRLVEPKEIQIFIDEVICKYSKKNGRCFVRPSGTEDIVRIYAEADTLQYAKDIAEEVKKSILDLYA